MAVMERAGSLPEVVSRAEADGKLTRTARRTIEDLFCAYKDFGMSRAAKGMTSRAFAHLCTDCGIIDSKFSRNAADVVFAKASVGSSGNKFISFDQFLKAVTLCADEKTVQPEDIFAALLRAKGPVVKGTTVAPPNKFHDSLKDVVAEDQAHVKAAPVRTAGPGTPASLSDAIAGALLRVYTQYRSFGAHGIKPVGLTSRQFSHMAKDANLVDGRLTAHKLDVIFFKSAAGSQGNKYLTFRQFQVALGYVAAEKGWQYTELCAAVLKNDGPTVTATVVGRNRFHDDQSTWTALKKGYSSKEHGTAGSRPSTAASVPMAPRRKTDDVL